MIMSYWSAYLVEFVLNDSEEEERVFGLTSLRFGNGKEESDFELAMLNVGRANTKDR